MGEGLEEPERELLSNIFAHMYKYLNLGYKGALVDTSRFIAPWCFFLYFLHSREKKNKL